MTTNNSRQKQQGMTLVEILVAMLIGLVLLSGVLTIFTNSKQTYRMQEALSRLQENSRFAMDFIARDVRQAGYEGCSYAEAVNLTKPSALSPAPITLPAGSNLFLTGSDNVANNWNSIACGGSNKCIAGTDTVSFHFGELCGNLSANMTANTDNIQISNCGIATNDVVLISDCAQADIFVATAVTTSGSTQTISHGAAKNSSGSLSKNFNTDSDFFKLRSSTFFIREGTGGQSSLYRLDNTKPASGTNPVELVEGVAGMQILYGVDSDTPADGIANYYVVATGVDMSKVVSIRISLLMQTIEDNIASSSLAINYNGVTLTPTDKRLRRVNTFTIALRNRLI